MNEDEAGVAFGLVVAIGGVVIGLCGPAVIAYQGLLWLQNGVWTPFAIRDALAIIHLGATIPDPSLSWIGVQKIVVWLLDFPLSIGLIVSGWLTCIGGVGILDEARGG
ncbi:hypothetical protein ACVMIH_005119 [Bradyrhizobium sp. USDA 4503]